MPDAQPPRLRISEPGDIAQIVPYLLGFTPDNSLVVAALQEGKIQVSARVDLDDVQPTGGVEGLLQRMWSAYPNAGGMAVAYTDDHLAGWDVLSRCDAWLPNGCTTLLVDADTWHTADGSTGPVDPNGALAQQATSYGMQHLASRSDLAARFASPPNSAELDRQLGDALPGMPEARDTEAIAELTNTLITRNLATPDCEPAALSATDAIQLSLLAQHPAGRDVALLRIDHDNAADHLALWQHVIQASPAHGADMPLFLAGMAAWISGDGASACIAAERALEREPPTDYHHPARLLEGIIDNVIPPAAWEPVRQDIIDHAPPQVRTALGESTPQARLQPGWPPTEPATSTRRPPAVRKPPGPGITI